MISQCIRIGVMKDNFVFDHILHFPDHILCAASCLLQAALLFIKNYWRDNFLSFLFSLSVAGSICSNIRNIGQLGDAAAL